MLKGEKMKGAVSLVSLILLLGILIVAGCSSTPSGGEVSQSEGNEEQRGETLDKLVITVQPGLGYAPLTVVKEMGWLEEELPDIEIEWRTLASGAAIREGLLAGEIQVGAGGIGPFLIGWDKGINWKVLTSLNNMELWLMAKDERYQSLEDFGPEDQIAMPGPDSIQSVVLRKGADEQLGDPRALDENIVALDHPTAMQALLSDQVAAHLTAPPFQMQEMGEGARAILRSYDLFGEHTFNSVWVMEDFYAAHPEIMDAIYSSVKRAVDLLNNEPDQAAELLSQDAGGQPTAEEFKKWMEEENISFTTQLHGFIKFAEVMQDLGMIEKVPAACAEIMYDHMEDPDSC